jgi:elongation factor Tu
MKILTIATSHVDIFDGEPALRARGLPGSRRLHQNWLRVRRRWTARILVVGADDGPMPQTREHIVLARQVGVR